MTMLPRLAKDAAARQAQFAATWRAVQGRLSLAGLAEEALRMAGPKTAPLRPLAAAARRYPLLAAGLLAGAGWMFRRTTGGAGKTVRDALQKRRSAATATGKDSNHENDQRDVSRHKGH